MCDSRDVGGLGIIDIKVFTRPCWKNGFDSWVRLRWFMKGDSKV